MEEREEVVKISSLQNPLVKRLVKLKKSRAMRTQEGSTLIEGIKLVREVCCEQAAKILLASSPELLFGEYKAEKRILTSREIIEKVSGTPSPEGIIAEVAIPAIPLPEKLSYLLVCDRIQDPGNLGTLLRTALALGWQGAFLLEGCCDPYGDKAIRAAKGATFHLPLVHGSWELLFSIAKKHELSLFAADAGGEDVRAVRFGEKVLFVLGSESQGLSAEAKSRCKRVAIPIAESVESLNVAAAGAILLWEAKNFSAKLS